MKQGTVKKISFTLVCAATVLVVFIAAQFFAALKKEAGILDGLPAFFKETACYFYFILLLTSFILFRFNKGYKSKFDRIASILYFLNGCALLLLVIAYGIEAVKSL